MGICDDKFFDKWIYHAFGSYCPTCKAPNSLKYSCKVSWTLLDVVCTSCGAEFSCGFKRGLKAWVEAYKEGSKEIDREYKLRMEEPHREYKLWMEALTSIYRNPSKSEEIEREYKLRMEELKRKHKLKEEIEKETQVATITSGEAVGDTGIATVQKGLSKHPEINKLANTIDYGIEKITEFRQRGVNDEALEECFVRLYSSVYSTLIASLYSTFEETLRRGKLTKEEFRQVTELLDQWQKRATSGNARLTKEDYEEFMRDVKKFDEKYPEFSDDITMSNLIKEFEEALKVNELIKKLDMCKKGKVETKEPVETKRPMISLLKLLYLVYFAFAFCVFYVIASGWLGALYLVFVAIGFYVYYVFARCVYRFYWWLFSAERSPLLTGLFVVYFVLTILYAPIVLFILALWFWGLLE